MGLVFQPHRYSRTRDLAGDFAGAFRGADVIVLTEMVSILKGYMPSQIADQTGIDAGVFGLVIVLFMLYEPLGLYGRWVKINLYFSTFPMYRKSTFKRQKTYTKTERLR